MNTKEILLQWYDSEKCPDFEPLLITVLAELNTLRDAMTDIATSCPLLNQDKNKMYQPGADSLFAQSTTTRMEKAQKALKESERLWTEFRTPEKNVSSGMENKNESTLVNPTGPTPSL